MSRIILELTPKNGVQFDSMKFLEDYTEGRPVDLSACSIQQITSIIHSFRPDFIDYIAKHGLTSLVTQEVVVEAIVAPGSMPSAIETLLKSFLGALTVTTDLVIVDPYFFAPTKDVGYPALIENILSPVLSGLQTLTIITLPRKVDSTLVSAVESALLSSAPNLKLVRKTTNSFHDRFWINPLSKNGFVSGTSLNGLGKKYALVDKLQFSDANDVINALKNENLI